MLSSRSQMCLGVNSQISSMRLKIHDVIAHFSVSNSSFQHRTFLEKSKQWIASLWSLFWWWEGKRFEEVTHMKWLSILLKTSINLYNIFCCTLLENTFLMLWIVLLNVNLFFENLEYRSSQHATTMAGEREGMNGEGGRWRKKKWLKEAGACSCSAGGWLVPQQRRCVERGREMPDVESRWVVRKIFLPLMWTSQSLSALQANHLASGGLFLLSGGLENQTVHSHCRANHISFNKLTTDIGWVGHEGRQAHVEVGELR